MGQYSTEGVSGDMAFKRRYTDAATGVDSYALVSVGNGATFTGILNDTYKEAVAGQTVTVTNGTLDVPASGKGHLRVYVLDQGGGDLVEQAEVGGAIAGEEEAVLAEAVVEGDQDDAVAGEGHAVVGGDRAGAVGEGAAVQPDHDGQVPGGVRRPHVQVEAVGAGDVDFRDQLVEGWGVGGLRHGGPVGEGVAQPVPAGRGSGPGEAQGAVGRSSVRNALEGGDAGLAARSSQGAVVGADDRLHEAWSPLLDPD